MLKQLVRLSLLCHEKRLLCRALLQRRAVTLMCSRKYTISQHKYANDFKHLEKNDSNYEFLTQYPTAIKYTGSFGIKVQPFSINAPHFYLRNFINELGHNMKIPYVYEDGYSAAMCLEYICRGCDKGSDLMKESYLGITREEWHEIYLAIDDEIDYLDERTMVSLISLYYKVDGFRVECFDKIYSLFTRQLKTRTKKDDVKQLCQWSDILMENENQHEGYTSLLNKIWDKILRISLKADDLLTVYQAAPEKRVKEVFNQLFPIFQKNLPYMSVYDLFMIGMEINMKTERTKEFQLMVIWIQKNLSKINADDLQAIMSNFTAAGYSDGFLCNVLSEFMSRQSCGRLDKKFLEVVLEYSTMCRFYDEIMLETACEKFLESDDYSSHELLVLLKAVGTLNYSVKKSYEFFSKVEAFLMKEAFVIRPEMLLEMAVYLMYMDRPLRNMADFIFSASFQGLIGELKDEDPALYRKCLVHLNLMYQGLRTVDFDPFPRLDIPDRDLYQRLNAYEYMDDQLYSEVTRLLRKDVPESKMGHFPRPTFQENYIELQFDENGEILDTIHPEKFPLNARYRKAILFFSSNAYCAKKDTPFSDHMLGSEKVNIDVLKNQGVEVVKLERKDIQSFLKEGTIKWFVNDLVRPNLYLLQQYRERIKYDGPFGEGAATESDDEREELIDNFYKPEDDLLGED